MREILFRGKTVKGKWVYGCLLNDKHDRIGFYNNAYKFEINAVVPKTVGQFTGLTDKNGKKIFEGDIVRLEDYWDKGKVFIVKYTDDKVGSCGCCFPEFGGIGFVMEAKDGERVCYDKDVIVIGNVTDNPELLESE